MSADRRERRPAPCRRPSRLGAGGIAARRAPAPPNRPATTAAPGETDYHWTPNPDLLAAAEGEVNVIAWAGYVEDGSTDPAVDWVTPFEDITGCAVNVQLGNTSDEMVAADAERRVRRRLGVG